MLRHTTRRRHYWLGVMVLPALMNLSACTVPQPRGLGELSRRIEPTTGRAFWCYLPEAYVHLDGAYRKQRQWPVIVSFHGMKPFDSARAQAREWQQEADRYGFVVIAPELRSQDLLLEFPVRRVHSALVSDEQATLAILDNVGQTTNADLNHVLSTSWSSGGYTAHYMLNRHPDRFHCLAVRQSNFSESILDANGTTASRGHPIMILNTQNDFSICKRESQRALEWYNKHGYDDVVWVHLKHLGHERTPDIAADFFAQFLGISATSTAQRPGRPREVLRGSPEGVALVKGHHEGPALRLQPEIGSRTPRRRMPSAPPEHRSITGTRTRQR